MKKRKIMIVFSILLLVLAGGLTLVHIFSVPKPEEVLTAYMQLIEAGNYEEMYQRIDADSKEQIAQEDFVSRNKNIYDGISARNISISVTDSGSENGKKLVSYSTTMDTSGGKVTFDNRAAFVRDKQYGYALVWDDSLIFPNLLKEDKVRVKTEKGKRGRIFDREGNVLAEDGTADSVGIVPGKLPEDRKTALAALAQLLMVSEESMETKLGAGWVKEDSFVPIKTISKGNGEMKKKLLEIPGVMITDVDARVYPTGGAAAHLTGYVQSVTAEDLEKYADKEYTSASVIGKVGLESLYEDILRGVDGCEIYIADKDGKKKRDIIARSAKDGTDVQLTIDLNLQMALYQKLQSDKGCAVVINPKTGETLALVSTPAYDPNAFVVGMSTGEWNTLNEDEAKPMYNRFKATFCPGSSMKPLTAAIGLSSSAFTADEDFGHSGRSWQKDTSWGDYYVTTLKEYGGTANLRSALVYSDNIYFAKAALKIGAEDMRGQLLNFGFGESFPYTFGLDASSFGSEQQFSGEINLADSGFGQGAMLVNPVHMASIYSAFVNEGNMIAPYLIKTEKPENVFIKEGVISKEIADEIKNDLIQVVEDAGGTAHSAQIQGKTLAGKTGTAEIKASQSDTTGTELGWFNAFTVDTADEDARLAVLMVEDVKDRGGSHYVLPLAETVFGGLTDE